MELSLGRFFVPVLNPDLSSSPAVFTEERPSFSLYGNYGGQVKRVFLALLPILALSQPGSSLILGASLGSRLINAYREKIEEENPEKGMAYLSKALSLFSLLFFFRSPNKQFLVSAVQDIIVGGKKLYQVKGKDFSAQALSMIGRVAISAMYVAAFTLCTGTSFRTALLIGQLLVACITSYKEWEKGYYLEAFTQAVLTVYLGTKISARFDRLAEEKMMVHMRPKIESGFQTVARGCFEAAHSLAQPVFTAANRGISVYKSSSENSHWKTTIGSIEVLARGFFSIPCAVLSVAFSSLGRASLSFSGKNYLYTPISGKIRKPPKGIFNLNVGALPELENRPSIDREIAISFDKEVPNKVGQGSKEEQLQKIAKYVVEKFQEGYNLALEEVVDRGFIRLLTKELTNKNLQAHLYTNMQGENHFFGISSGLSLVTHNAVSNLRVFPLVPSQSFLNRAFSVFSLEELPNVLNVHTHFWGEKKEEQLESLLTSLQKEKGLFTQFFLYGDFNHNTKEELEKMTSMISRVFSRCNFQLLTPEVKNDFFAVVGEVLPTISSIEEKGLCLQTDHPPLKIDFSKEGLSEIQV